MLVEQTPISVASDEEFQGAVRQHLEEWTRPIPDIAAQSVVLCPRKLSIMYRKLVFGFFLL